MGDALEGQGDWTRRAQGPVRRAVLLQGKTRMFSGGSGRVRAVKGRSYKRQSHPGIRHHCLGGGQSRSEGELGAHHLSAEVSNDRSRTISASVKAVSSM